jgi:cruciform cutting endonuclease 1
MGIRNLAYCAIEIPARSITGKRDVEMPSFKVDTWTRMDLAARMSHPPASEAEAETTTTTTTISDIVDGKSKSKSEKSPRRAAPKVAPTFIKDAFSPSRLSTTAYSVTRELLALRPDEILIERQRFRSGGAAAVQEWTVRVNMLESMLWACLETLREMHHNADGPKKNPEVSAVEPARVARFWVPGEDVPLVPPQDLFALTKYPGEEGAKGVRRKVEKRDKVAVVKAWIEGDSDVRIDFEGQAAEMAEAFREEKVRGSARQIAGGKLDDLADCLLQGVAWVRWEENRRRIEAMWAERG